MNKKASELINSLHLTMAVNGKDFYKMYFADDVEEVITNLCGKIETLTDLKQLQEDSFASAMRRFPNSTCQDVLDKLKEEVLELQESIVTENESSTKIQSPHCPELTTVEEEWADVLFALLVFAKLENIDIDKALRIKNEFNKTRK